MDLDVLVPQRPLHESVDRALADLTRAVDVEGTYDDCRESEFPIVGVRQMLAGKLTDCIRPTRFTDCAHDGGICLLGPECVGSEHLARRKTNDSLRRAVYASRLEDVRRAQHVHPHCAGWRGKHRVHTGNRCEMYHNMAALNTSLKIGIVEHIPFDDGQILVLVK